MTLRVIGAGLGRTGTNSLKEALELLLGGTCHHMYEVFRHPDEVPVWHAAVTGDPPDWSTFMAPYVASVDFPSAACWRELSEAFPDAPVLLSTRESAEIWWRSADATIFETLRREPPPEAPPVVHAQVAMARDMLAHRLTPDWNRAEAAMAAYERHNAEVRATIATDRLIEHRPGDGWAPLREGLGVPVPDVPYPHTNTTAEFRAGLGLD